MIHSLITQLTLLLSSIRISIKLSFQIKINNQTIALELSHKYRAKTIQNIKKESNLLLINSQNHHILTINIVFHNTFRNIHLIPKEKLILVTLDLIINQTLTKVKRLKIKIINNS